MKYAIWITKDGIRVIDAMDVVSKENAEVLFSVAKNTTNNSVPIVEGVLDVDLFAELVGAVGQIDINEFTKKSFAAILGAMAALAVLPKGPAVALIADQAVSSAFEEAYDSVGEWSQNYSMYFIDFIERTRAMYTMNSNDYLLNSNVNTSFAAARNFFFQRDPLVLDLDGDGLELTAAGGSVLFDHNADGIRTGTGWARPDDGLLVRDLNGNGLIDTGRELFGVDTFKSNGQLATQGFDALADLDSNADGQITSADAAWSELQVWRDLNQDGISQAGELNTLASLNITQIGLNGSSTGPQAGQTIRNNFVALSTTYTRAGVARTVGAIDLEVDAFFSDIPPGAVDEAGSPVTITAEAQALPQMTRSLCWRRSMAAGSTTRSHRVATSNTAGGYRPLCAIKVATESKKKRNRVQGLSC